VGKFCESYDPTAGGSAVKNELERRSMLLLKNLDEVNTFGGLLAFL
jgi:hypothetical protein